MTSDKDYLTDNETLLDFDPFLVGEGSYSDMKSVKNPFNQITGVSSVSDLKSKTEDYYFTQIDDLHDFDKKEEPVKDYFDLFVNRKMEILDRFGYLSEKSLRGHGKLVSGIDLAVTDNDRALLKKLEVKSKNMVLTIADLSSYADMRFEKLKYYNVNCECPVCSASTGITINTVDAFHQVMGPSRFLHKGFDGLFIPVIPPKMKSDFQIFGVDYFDMPIEFYDILVSRKYKSDKPIKFLDFSKIESWEGEVVCETESSVLVHDDYIGNSNAVDFLYSWFHPFVSKVDMKGIFYYKGRKVEVRNGNYFDIEKRRFL